MSGYLDKDQFHVPLRTRERAAVEAARSALRNIATQVEDKQGDSLAPMIAIEALERIAVILGERQ